MHTRLLICFLLFASPFAHANRIQSQGSGNFNEDNTWLGGISPGVNDTAVIRGLDVVTLSFQNASIRALYIEPSGELVMQTSNLIVADTILNRGSLFAYSASSVGVGGLENKGVDNRGYLRIGYGSTFVLGNENLCNRLFASTGELLFNPNSITYLYGRTRITAGILTQNGGEIYFYGNSSVAGTSVPENENIVFMNAAQFNCTEGSMCIADPHFATFFPFVNTVEITGNNANAFSGNHTWFIGNGLSNKPAHANRGIMLGNGVKNGSKAPINHCVVQTGLARNFITSISSNSGTYIKGNFTVTGSSEARHVWTSAPEMAIGGNIDVQPGSVYTNSQLLILGAASGYSISNKQEIIAGGTIRETDFNPQFHFGALLFNNLLANDTAVLFRLATTIAVRDSIVFQNGVAAMQSLQLGNSSYAAKSRVVNGGVIASDAGLSLSIYRYYHASLGNAVSFNSGYDVFPFASATDFTKRTLQVQVNQLTANGNLQAVYYDGIGSNPAHPATHGTDNGIFCNMLSRQYWYFQPDGSMAGTGVQVRCTGGNILLDGSATNIRLHKLGGVISGNSNGGGTLVHPQATKTNVGNIADLAGTYYFAGNSSLMVTKIPSLSSGNAQEVSNWKFSKIPDANYGAIVKSGHTLTDETALYWQPRSLDVENGGKLVLAKPGGQFLVYNKTILSGTVEVTQNTWVYFSKWVPEDTALFITSSGRLTISHALAAVHLLNNASYNNRLGNLVNYGSLQVQSGKLHCFGYLHLHGNSSFNLGDDAEIYLFGNNSNPTQPTQTLLDIATTGSVQANYGSIYFTDPPKNIGQHTLRIQRNTSSQIDLTHCRMVLGANIPQLGGGNGQGAENTGFKLETQAGTVNVPIGKLEIGGAPGLQNRFARNGDKALFILDSLFIRSQGRLHIFPSTGENILGGEVLNQGQMVSEGKLILGGTTQFPGKEYIRLKGVVNQVNFVNALVNPTASFNELEIRHIGQSVQAEPALTVANKLRLTKGFFSPAGGLTLGTGTSNTGELILDEGRLYASPVVYSFTRWFSTATISQGSINGLFPFATASGDRFVYISGTPGSGGTVGFSHNDDGSYFNIGPFAEAGVTLGQVHAPEWKGLAGNGFASNNIGLRIIGGGLQVQTPANARMISGTNSLMASGTHVSATGSNTRPVIERTGVHATNLINGMRIAAPTDELFANINSVNNGSWTSPATWDCNCIPNAGSRINIGAHHVKLNKGAGHRKAERVSISSAGTLEIAGDTLTLTRGGLSMPQNGTLKVTGGTFIWVMDYYKNFTYVQSGNFALDSGKMIIAAPGLLSAPGMHSNAIEFSGSGSFSQKGGMLFSYIPIRWMANSKVNVTGGNMYFLTHTPNAAQPHLFSQNIVQVVATSDPAFPKSFQNGTLTIANPPTFDGFQAINISLADANAVVPINNYTFILGDSTLPEDVQTVNSNGFSITAYSKLGNLLVAGGNKKQGRFATFSPNAITLACDNLYIAAGSEWRNPQSTSYSQKLFIHGNLQNLGTLTTYVATIVMGGGYKGSIANTPQIAGGSGRFRYSPGEQIQSYEPWLDALEINNLGTEGVELKRNFKVSRLILTNGDVKTDTLQVGYADFNPGAIQPTGSGAIIGHISKWVKNDADVFNIPVGVPGVRRNLKMTIQQSPGTTGLLTFSFVGKNGGNLGLPLNEGGTNIVSTAPEGYWRIYNHGVGFTWYNIEATAASLGNVDDYSKLVLLKRTNTSSPWTLEGTHNTTTGNNSLPVLYRTNLMNFSEFGIGLPSAPAIPANTLWTGNVSSEWFNAGNWNNGVPGSKSTATIPGNRPRYPLVTNHVQVKTLQAQNGSSIRLDKNIMFNINGTGNQ